jgi:hypothetical protein
VDRAEGCECLLGKRLSFRLHRDIRAKYFSSSTHRSNFLSDPMC